MPIEPKNLKRSQDESPLGNPQNDLPSNILEDTNVVMEEDGGATVTFGDHQLPYSLEGDENDHFANLVPYVDASDLEELAQSVYDACESDRSSRQEWENIITKGMRNLGIAFDYPDEAIMEGGCTVKHPVILESAVKYQARAAGELLPSGGPCKTQIIGKKTEEKERRSLRVCAHMNYQTTKEMVEYYTTTEKMLLAKALLGSCFKKMSYNPTLARPYSEVVTPDCLIVNNRAADLSGAERVSHVIYKTPREIRQDYIAGLYLEPEDDLQPTVPQLSDFEAQVRDIMGLAGSNAEYDSVHTLIEQHCYLSFDNPVGEGENVPLPYVVTVDKDSLQVLSIRRNWRPEDLTRQKINWFVHYTFIPMTCFYGLGYIHILGNFQASLTTIIRSLVDAGQFANLPAGLKRKSVRILDSAEPIAFGEWRDIENSSNPMGAIGDDFMPLQYKEPSQVLFAMLELLDSKAQKFADSTEEVVSDSTNYGPVGTTMALLEQSQKLFSAIHKRAYFSQEQELKILAEINYFFLDDEYPYDIVEQSNVVFRDDYDPRTVDVLPVANPNISSKSERMAMAQTQLQMAMQAPSLHDLHEAYKRFYISLGVEEPDKLLKDPERAKPADPVTDILNAVSGEPIKAFPGQNHQSHVAIKQSFLQSPSYGGNELMQGAISQALTANIREHMIMDYQEQLGAMTTGAATDEESLELVLAEKAQELARLDQIAQEEKESGSPAKVLADAEKLRSETDAQKEARTERENEAKIGLQGVETMRKYLETLSKLDSDNFNKEIKSMELFKDLADAGSRGLKANDPTPKG